MDLMRQAVAEAQKGIKRGNGPFGAIIIKGDKVIAKAHNQVIEDNDPTAHAEVTAIRKACKKLRTHDLSGMTIYSTCEPCPMCFSAIYWARIKKIVYGADIETAKRYGFNELEISNYKMRSLGRAKIEIEADFMPRECAKLFKEWEESGNEAY